MAGDEVRTLRAELDVVRQRVNELFAVNLNGGWTEMPRSWIYVTAITVTEDGDASDKYGPDDKVRFRQDAGTYQYATVVSAVYTTLTTITLTMCAGSALANESLWDVAVSKAATPQGFPVTAPSGFVPLTTPLTSTSWDGDAKTTGDNGILDLSVVFSAPAGIKAIAISMSISDETVNAYGYLGPAVGQPSALIVRTVLTTKAAADFGIVPCDANGDVYWSCSGELDSVTIKIWGYWT